MESGICIPVAAPLAAPKNGHRYDLDNETYVFDPNQVTSSTNRSAPKAEICHTLPASSTPSVGYNFNDYQSAVRRLTPRECERLQGLPDDYTLIQYRNKPAADGPRYKVIGNSMAEPVIRWIGERIQIVDAL